LKSGYSLNYYFILQTDSSGGKNHSLFVLIGFVYLFVCLLICFNLLWLFVNFFQPALFCLLSFNVLMVDALKDVLGPLSLQDKFNNLYKLCKFKKVINLKVIVSFNRKNYNLIQCNKMVYKNRKVFPIWIEFDLEIVCLQTIDAHRGGEGGWGGDKSVPSLQNFCKTC
jgi:hypothetical protein